MNKDVYSYLEKNYRYLTKYINDFNETLFKTPHSALIKGRTYSEHLTLELCKLEIKGVFTSLTQVQRLRALEIEGVIDGDILNRFHSIRMLGNKAAHANVEGELEGALRMHKDLYKITCWFVECYLDPKFEAEEYKSPMPEENTSSEHIKLIKELAAKIEAMEKELEKKGHKEDEVVSTSTTDTQGAFEDIIVEDIFRSEDKKCLVQDLARLKESSREAVEGLGEFSPFKRYMHIERDAQKELEGLIKEASVSERAQLILVCGSVGDGKSHIISYFNNKYPEIMKKFILHNDATESLEPNKTSMDTLNEVLDDFSDEKIQDSKTKFILAINLGTLNNFIDSEYGKRFSILKKYVQEKKILETSIEDSSFDNESSIQFVNFGDYHIFTLKDGRVYSKYIKSLIMKITDSADYNIFYSSYKKNCEQCKNCNCCPIKANYELLSNDNVQEAIIDLLVQTIIKNKIIISTRALLNFMYELIVPRTYIDINSALFKNNIGKISNLKYVESLMPNILFNHKELSFIFEALNTLDPLNVRNQKVDDFIVKFNNSVEILPYFKDYIDFPENYVEKFKDIRFDRTEERKIKYELLKLFIRSYYLCGKGDIFTLKDSIYEEFMKNLYFWNRGDKGKLKTMYDNVKNGIVRWNGEAGKDQINIFLGKNQTKYKISEELELKADISNLPKNSETHLDKFITTLKVQFKNNKGTQGFEIDVDFSLYKLLIQVINGYRPNKKDKNHVIKFIEFVKKLEGTGSQNESLVFTEKNKDSNKKFKLEYDTEFEIYKFVEI